MTGGSDVAKLRRLLGIALLVAAIMVWAIAIVMSPHGEAGAGGAHVKASIALFARNAALGTMVLVAIATALLFWRRPPRKEPIDLVLLAAIAILAASSFYQLLWLETDVLDVEQVQAPSASDGT